MKHTRSGYRDGCRCEHCILAQRDYCREWARSKAAPLLAPCPGCGEVFLRNGRRRWCSPECKKRRENLRARRLLQLAKAEVGTATASTWVWVAGTCTECGDAFVRHGQASPYCSKACSSRARRRARRALTRIGIGAHVIHERDGWTCHICGDAVNRAARVPELDAPTLDHVVALAMGGSHDESNLKTAHFYCNSVKRDLPLSVFA